MTEAEEVMEMAGEKCLRDEDFKRLDTLVTKVFEKMDRFMDGLHRSDMNDSVNSGKIVVLERDVQNAYNVVKQLKADFKEVSDWRQRFEGGIKVMLAIPVLCTIITTGFAIYSITR